jgi:predicted nucleotidyltransferase
MRSNDWNDVVLKALAALHDQMSPVMVFGSHARGDATPASDVDVLELSERRPRSYKMGSVSVARYKVNELRAMAEAGSLFVLHLVREGTIIRDPCGTLRQCLSHYVKPRSYDDFRRRLTELAQLLDVDHSGYQARWRRYHDLVVFVVRSALYSRFADAGQPVFSINEISRRVKDADISDALAMKSLQAPVRERFNAALTVTERLLGPVVHNSFGTLEALIVNAGLENGLVLGWGLRLLECDVDVPTYHVEIGTGM